MTRQRILHPYGGRITATNPRHAHPLLVLYRLTAAQSPETLFQGAKRAQHQNWRHIANSRKFTDGETAQFAPRCPRAAPALYQDVEDIAVLVGGTPKIVLLAAATDENLVHVPLVARLWPAPLQRIGENPAEAQTPLADALVADHDPTRRQDQLNITQAQTEAVIEPDGMLDDLAREAEASIQVRRHRHAAQPATAGSRRQPDIASRRAFAAICSSFVSMVS